MVWLLDTSILVDLLRGTEAARQWIDTLPKTERAISVVTGAELLAGCHNLREQRLIERELALYTMLGIEEGHSLAALRFYQQFHLSQGVGFLDCVIAATALGRKFSLATLNLKHFRVFSNLQVKKPY